MGELINTNELEDRRSGRNIVTSNMDSSNIVVL